VLKNSASHESSNRHADADADATGQLDILDADDILESDDISALEAAAAGFTSFEVATPEPSGFEVGEIGDLEDAEVEGEIEAPPPSLSTFFGMKEKVAPVKTAPIPAAPVTSPLPLESVVAREEAVAASAALAPRVEIAAHAEPEVEVAPISRSEPLAERTLELKRVDLALASTQLEARDQEEQAAAGHTEVLVRSAMPSAIRTMHGGAQAPAPAPAPVAARRPSSIAPVALDVAAARPAMASVPAFPPPARMPSYASMTPKRGLSGLAIGVIACSALALVGLVGIGGYAASRALTDKAEPIAVASPESPAAAGLVSEGVPSTVVVAPSPAEAPIAPPSAPAAPNASPASVGTGSAIDVSALPTAPTPSVPAPRGIITGRTSSPAAPAAAPLAAAGPAAPAAAPVTKTSGGALPPPGGGKVASGPLAAPGAPLPPPPAPAAAPVAAPTSASTTGTVRVDPNLRAVVVDGSFRRANDGVVVVSCGSHRIKAGMKEQQTVNVPCGGSVSL
jgi:hypothetical protein